MDTSLTDASRGESQPRQAGAELAGPGHASPGHASPGHASLGDAGAAAFPPLPDPAPLAMPTQSLRIAPPVASRPFPGRLPSAPRGIFVRRCLVIGGAAALSLAGTYQMYLVLGINGLVPLTVFMLVLFLALFSWIALSFTSALAGFVSLVLGGGKRLIAREPSVPRTRTALLMPTYNESPSRVAAGLQAIDESLGALGAAGAFDIFILSDTVEPETWIAEEAEFLALRHRTGGHDRIFYRRRAQNIARKSGNIADWVMRFGGAYPQFLILDADSVMTGESLLHLVAAMEAHPDVGLIQTLPVIAGGTTLFARLQQFAGRVYGPLIAHGIAWWHGAEGNYWGHNALIRTNAFAAQAGLPELRGRKPFGGHILSHDFVEAALIRRGGWAVHMVPALAGSFEECPPSLIDLAQRDRRWCQGNLQHAAVLPARGLAWINRLHLLTGIGCYLTAPLWLLFLLTGILVALRARFVPPNYFPAGKSLFPQWPVIDPVRAMWMFVGTMALLLAPKLLGAIAVMLHGRERRGCGGSARLLVSMLLETLISGLIAPVVMLTQSADVCQILLGRDSGWSTQRRDDGSVPARAIIRRYWRHTALGLLLGGVAWAVSPYLALWMLPVVLGLALAIPLVALTGQRTAGLALRRLGLLRTPEELEPPGVLARAMELSHRADAARDAEPVTRLLDDAALLAAHRRMLPPPRRAGIDPMDVALLIGRAKLDEAASLEAAWAGLTRAERAAVLADKAALERLAELHARTRTL
jgi:membrane glycosyltransferase